MKLPLIAIDGPAGAGKSSTARAVAKKLGLPYLDTGALFRAVSWAVKKKAIDTKNHAAIAHLVGSINIRFTEGDHGTRVWVDNYEVTTEIRSPEITQLSSIVCMQPEVRKHVGDWQKKWIARGFGVMEGRDVGTEIVPHAGLKLYMTARPGIRAVRRARDLGIQDDQIAISNLAKEIEDRDRRDSERKESPLRLADDAIVLDTSDMTFDEQINKIVNMAADRFELKLYAEHRFE